MGLITYTKNIEALREELQQISQDGEHPLGHIVTTDNNVVKLVIDQVPVYHNKDETLCVCRGLSRSQVEQLGSLEVLGEVVKQTAVFDSDEAEATYDRVRGPLEVTYQGEDGEELIASRPYLIGAFA